MALGLGTISSVFKGSERSIDGTAEHQRQLSYGNQMGLKPETGDVSDKYQRLLTQFEQRYGALIDPPADLNPDSVTDLEFEAAEAIQQQQLRQDFRKYTQQILGTEIGEYKAILSAQNHAETQSNELQSQNINYLKGNVQRSFDSAKAESRFGGWLSAFRESANRNQNYVDFR